MDWGVICYIVFMNLVIVKGRYKSMNLQNLIDFVKRRSILMDDDILGVPKYSEHLPRAEKILPGHTLLKPSFGMLKSSVKFPQRTVGRDVYGNVENIGVSYGNTNQRIRYSDFRKSNTLMATIMEAIKNINSKNKIRSPVVVIEVDPSQQRVTENELNMMNKMSMEEENSANEILDDLGSLYSDGNVPYNRRSRKIHSAFRNRRTSESTESSDSSQSSASSDYEKNPGNPYTIHKDKYKQNWLWYHKLDGDHMNVNPYAPVFQNFGPSGPSLFFSRKWWYFNQDDFKPLE